MKTWRIPVVWNVFGEYEIEADTLKEAVEKAYNKTSFPEDREYINDSFTVEFGDNLKKLRDEYNDGQEDEIKEEPLKTYDVEISVIEEYTGYTTIQARNEEEAKEKATDEYFADEIEMSFTNMEGIKNVKVSEIKEEK